MNKIPVATSTEPVLNFTQKTGNLLQPIPKILNEMSQIHVTYQLYKSLEKFYSPTDSVINEIDFDSPFDPYLASESALSDWLSPEEDEAWAYLQEEK